MNSNIVTSCIEATRSGTKSKVARETIMPVSANRTHGRLIPNCGNRIMSMTGPQMNLKVQGKYTVANSIAICSTAIPLVTRNATKATFAKPEGRPCAT